MPVFFGVGVVVTLLMTLHAGRTFFWWPLHPLGYTLSGSWSTIEFWFPCLLAWGCKSLVLRYGGMRVYGRARPLFLGMVLGAFGMALLFVLLDAVSPEDKIPVPPFPWG